MEGKIIFKSQEESVELSMNQEASILSALKKASGVDSPNLEFTDNLEFGDFSSNIAMSIFANQESRIRNQGIKSTIHDSQFKSPHKLAENIVNKLKSDKELSKIVDRIETAGPGFINFWLKKDVFVSNLIQIDKEKEDYGKSKIGNGKTLVIDYSSPNIAKPFGIGHLRSTVIGQAIYNLYKFLGYKTIGDNHLGDWGTQFGKLLYMIDLKKTKDYSIDNLEKLYVEFHNLVKDDESLEKHAREWFKKLEDGESIARTVWKQCINVSLNEFNRIYDMLNVKIDNAFGESFYEEEMREMQNDPKISKFLVDGEDGKSKVIDLTSIGITTPLMFLKSDGGTTYATRDLATIVFRVKKYNPDIIVYEVGVEQRLHFKQLFAAAKILNLINDDVELVHTAHGLYLAPDGKKFSTRGGKTIKLEEVLDEAIERAKKLGNKDDKTAKDVGIGAIKYFDLMHSVQSNVVFDWEKIMNMEGNSGPYLQYTVARCNSVIQKASTFKGQALQDVYSNLNEEESKVLRTLVRFSGIIATAAKSYSPNLLCSYLYDLAQKYNSFYNAHRIIGDTNQEFRIMLTKVTGQVLKNGLKLLGIDTPEKM